jgi:hypothetical protein
MGVMFDELDNYYGVKKRALYPLLRFGFDRNIPEINNSPDGKLVMFSETTKEADCRADCFYGNCKQIVQIKLLRIDTGSLMRQRQIYAANPDDFDAFEHLLVHKSGENLICNREVIALPCYVINYSKFG